MTECSPWNIRGSAIVGGLALVHPSHPLSTRPFLAVAAAERLVNTQTGYNFNEVAAEDPPCATHEARLAAKSCAI
jgi:hypothetical protein